MSDTATPGKPVSPRRVKLLTLAASEGFDGTSAGIREMIGAAVIDSVVPAICMNAGCDYTCGMEPDQDAGWCEMCDTNSVKSCLILAGLI